MKPEHRSTNTAEGMNVVKKLAIVICVTMAIMGPSVSIAGSDIPNLVGTWILKS